MGDFPGQQQSNLRYYKKRRCQFAATSYFFTVLFLFIAFLQWFLFYHFDSTRIFFLKHVWFGIIFFVINLFLALVFIFFEELRFLKPLNYILTFTIIECIIVGVTSLVVRHYKYYFIVSFFVWVLVLAFFILCGTIIPHDLTLDVVVLFVLSVVCLIGAMYFLMLYLVFNVPYTFYVHFGLIVTSIVLFVMYHAQIINGGRFAEMRTGDYLLAALILFYDFILMFLFSFYLAPKWTDFCEMPINGSFWWYNTQPAFLLTLEFTDSPKELRALEDTTVDYD